MAREFSRQFYHSKQWKDIRSYVLKRDNYLCRSCGSPAQEVHHIIHLRPDNIGDLTITMNPDNLVSLCRNCHFDEHRQEKIAGRKEQCKKDECAEEFYFDENGFLQRVDSPS